MNTSKSIAGISYNTEEFLKGTLEDWKREGIIEFAMFIHHKAEADEKKDHFHVYIIPAKRLQTVDLELKSQEFDPMHPDKPLKLLGLTPSKESDWLLYALHDPTYLIEKGLEKAYHYSLEDFKSTDLDLFDIIVSRIGETRNGKIENRVIQMIRNGMTWNEMLTSGLIPMRYVYSAKIIFDSFVIKEE